MAGLKFLLWVIWHLFAMFLALIVCALYALFWLPALGVKTGWGKATTRYMVSRKWYIKAWAQFLYPVMLFLDTILKWLRNLIKFLTSRK